MIIFFTRQQRVKVLENPRNAAPEFIYQRIAPLEKTPNKPTVIRSDLKMVTRYQ